MIAKVMTGGTRFARRVEYVQKGGDALCQIRNLVSLETAATEMAATAALAQGCELPSYHFILSWAELERPTDQQMFQAADLAIAELGMAEHQALIAIHRDRANHDHVHVVLNRVHPTEHRGAVIWKDYVTLERACRRIERRQGWAQDRGHFDVEVVSLSDGGEDIQLVAASRRRDGEARPTQGELAIERRTGQRPLSTIVGAERDAISTAFTAARSWAELSLQLAPLGLSYEAKGTGAVLRSTTEPDDVIKPSSLNRAWSRAKLEQRFGPMSSANQAGNSKGKIDGPDHKPNVAKPGAAPPPAARGRLLNLQELDVVHRRRSEMLLPRHVRGDLVDVRSDRNRPVRRPEPGPGLAANPRERLWQQFQVERQAAGSQRAAQQAEWEAQRAREKARRSDLIERQKNGRDWIYRLLPRGIVRGVFLWFQKQKQEADWAMLRAEQAAERQALRERRQAASASPRNWRDWVELQAKAGDQQANVVLEAMKFRDKPKPKGSAPPPRPDPERELVAMRQLKLLDVAGRYGYVLATGSKPDHASIRMKNAAGDVIVVKQDRARGDRYFRTDGAARGNVLEFVQFEIQGTLADVRQALRPLIGELPPAPNGAGGRPLADPPAADHTAARQAWMTARPGLIGFLQNRGILNATIARFQSEIRVDSRGNALFAHRDAAGNLVGFEMKNHDFAGFAKGGQKTIAVFGPAFAKRIVVTESGLDALSAAQIEARDDTRYVSFGGAPGRRAFDELRRLAVGADQVVIGTDNDAAGDAIAARIRTALADIPRLAVTDGKPPVGNDWNDTLRAALAADTLALAAQDLVAIDNPVKRRPAKGRGGEGIGG